MSSIAQLHHVREVNVLVALLLVGALISLASPYFLTTNNLMGVFRAFSLTAIMSIGMVMVIITGGIDLSVGSAMGLSSLVTALAFEAGLSMAASISAGLGVGLVFGLSNGLLITAIGLPPFIATLGTLDRTRTHVHDHAWCRLRPSSRNSSRFCTGLYRSRACSGRPMTLLMVVFAVIMGRTRFGRHVYATGGRAGSAPFRRKDRPGEAVGLRPVVRHRFHRRHHRLHATLSAEPASGFDPN
ncbi:hypothetical protein QW131_33665 [Roseibium salinum]|nr:hypothetical protein [Roseibium salinum]